MFVLCSHGHLRRLVRRTARRHWAGHDDHSTEAAWVLRRRRGWAACARAGRTRPSPSVARWIANFGPIRRKPLKALLSH